MEAEEIQFRTFYSLNTQRPVYEQSCQRLSIHMTGATMEHALKS
jgi:hypothetical protein